MEYINCNILMIQPRLEFKEFLLKLCEIYHKPREIVEKMDAESIRMDSVSFLIPPMETADELIKFIEENYLQLFAASLMNWCPDSSQWPEHRDLRLFYKWFEPQIQRRVVNYDTQQKRTKGKQRTAKTKTAKEESSYGY